MKNLFVKFFIIILIIVFIMAFSSSYSSLNIDNEAFVVAIGIDTSDIANLKVSFELVKVPSDNQGSTSESKIIINTVDASSLSNAINIMNAYLGKALNLSHCKIIVFSEDFAQNGISDEIYFLMNDIEIRPTTNIVVSKCNAKYYIAESKPSLENMVTKYYDIFPTSSEYTGYLYNATIGDFFNDLISDISEPYTILGGLTSSGSSSDYYNSSTKNSNLKSNNSPITGDRKTENIGLAVFKKDKLVGELTAIETICFSLLKSKSDSFLISVDNPEKENSFVDVYLTASKNPNIIVKFINGSPYIKINLNLTGKIYSMTDNSKYLNTDVLDIISKECSNYLESNISNFLYKTSIEYNSDITGLGKYSLSKFLNLKDLNNFNWKNNYKNCIFDIRINTNIDSSFLLDQS